MHAIENGISIYYIKLFYAVESVTQVGYSGPIAMDTQCILICYYYIYSFTCMHVTV